MRAIFILFILGLLARLYMGGTTKTPTMRGLRLCILKKDKKACQKIGTDFANGTKANGDKPQF